MRHENVEELPHRSQSEPENGPDLVVLKFGGSVLRDASCAHLAAHEVYRYVRRGQKVLAVVSALAGQTDALLKLAAKTGDQENPPGMAELVRLGEMQAAAILALALQRLGLEASAIDPAHIGLRAHGPADDAVPAGLDPAAFDALLAGRDVLVMPGYCALGEDGSAALLGRGGSDMSAIYLGQMLGARQVRLVKDVDGIYADDPKTVSNPRRYGRLNWDEAGTLGGQAIQPRALAHARRHDLEVQIAAPARRHETSIRNGHRAALAPVQVRRLKVALLGFGTVGQGVYAHLMRHADLFEVCGILVRDLAKPRGEQAPAHLISDTAAPIIAARPDIVIEMIGGVDAAQAYILNGFFGGADVVSANKTVIAAAADELVEAARRAGRELRYSAAVGGGVPMLEALDQVREAGGVAAVSGIINGTANFILGRLAEGCAFDVAVREAQQKGFAEADPSADLDGDDAAAKLILMARHGFGLKLDREHIACESLRDLDPQRLAEARAQGRCIRQVSALYQDEQGALHASVRLQSLPAGHYLAGARGECNRLLIEGLEGTELRLSGKGAGRWPTAEAVMADVLDIHRLRGQEDMPWQASAPQEAACA